MTAWRTYTLVLYTTELDGRTIYKLRMRWKSWKSSAYYRLHRKTWKYKVLENALRRIRTIEVMHGKPRTLDIMGYLAQYEGPPGLSGPAEPR